MTELLNYFHYYKHNLMRVPIITITIEKKIRQDFKLRLKEKSRIECFKINNIS